LKTIQLIEKIEGEATLKFSYNGNKIDFIDIEFFNTRNIENILLNKPALDALVINPRVCGICGHAHLQATAKALEDCIDGFTLSNKAKIIRELSLNFEIIQNHFKWFYMTIMPLLGYKDAYIKALYPSQTINKAIATIAGQYPHNSYAIVGGIVSEVTTMDLVRLKSLIDEVVEFFEKEVVQNSIENIQECDNVDLLLSREGDLPKILHHLKKQNLDYIGKSYDRFIVFGSSSYFKSGKSNKTRVTKSLDTKYIKEIPNKISKAKNVTYKDKYFEVGPLSRAMLNKTSLIKDAHRKYGDSIFSRIIARVCEIPQLLLHSKDLISQIDLTELSYIEPRVDISQLSGTGVGIVEAARGSLIHKVKLQNGVIKDYQIITPTQWNLGNGTKESLGIAQKAMVGLDDEHTAELVFKTFDVCSVCTTH
jgi:hydrogenase large subunit